MSLNQWLEKIETYHVKEIDLGLERSHQILERIRTAGHFSPDFFIVTIGGTNGKGTTLKFLENAAVAAKLRVGSYTSPHVFVFNERVRINGTDIDDDSLIKAFEIVESCREDTALTYYEFTTLAAFIIYAQQDIDLLLLEVGLGGRLDTVNLLDADVAVITSIALDHQAFLGNTRELIAAEKVAIARPGRPLFMGGNDVPAAVQQYAGQHQLQLFDFTTRKSLLNEHSWSLTFDLFQDSIHLENLSRPKIPLSNAALALQVWFYIAKHLQVAPESVDLHKLVAETALFGRFTQLAGDLDVRVDAAHNPAAAQCLAEQLAHLSPKKTTAICGIMADKDVDGTLQPMLPVIDQWVLWPLTGGRALAAAALQDKLLALGVKKENIAILEMSDVKSAGLNRYLQEQGDARFIVFGSFFTIEAFMNKWR